MDTDKQIYKFNAKILVNNGFLNVDEGIIECSEDVCDLAFIALNDNHDSLLFDQTRKAIPGVPFKQIYVVLDFSKFKNDDLLSLIDYPNGFILNIDGKNIRFVEFIKSSSMSRVCKCFYINVDYFAIMHERIGLGFDSSSVKISKWFAYSGLSCSSTTICSDIVLKKDDVAIVDDKFSYIYADCITALSVPYLYDLLKQLKKKLLVSPVKLEKPIKTFNVPSLQEIYHELNCYVGSKDYLSLDPNIKTFLDQIYDLFDLNYSDAIKKIGSLKDYYAANDNDLDKIIWNKISVNNFKLKINYFDGCGIITKEFARAINKSLKRAKSSNDLIDKNHFSFQIRMPFLKGMVHAVDFKDFLYTNNIEQIKSIVNFNGNKEYELKDVNKLKMVIPLSMFKAAAYLENIDSETLANYCCSNQIEYYFQKLNEYQYPLAVANKEGKDDDDRQLNYQFLTTLPLDDTQLKHLIDSNKEKIKSITSTKEIIKSIEGFGDEFLTDLDVYKINPSYYLATSRYQGIRNAQYVAAKNNMACGKLYISSERRYLTSDLLAFMYHAGNLKMPESEQLTLNNVYMPYSREEKNKIKRFNINFKNEAILLLRNPHYSPNEIVALNRNCNEKSLRHKYFKHLYGTLMINPLSGAADRLGGADYDGDTVLAVNDWNLTSKVKSRIINTNGYVNNLVKIPSLSETSKLISHENVVRSFNQTFSSKTGLISNQAFAKAIQNPANLDSLAYFTILNGLEIDSAKNGRKPQLDSEYSYDKPFFLEMKDELKKNKKSNYLNQDYCQSRLFKLKDTHLLYNIAYEISNYKIDFSRLDEENLKKSQSLKDGLISPFNEPLKHTISLFDALVKLDYIRSALKLKRREHSNNSTLARSRIENILNNKGFNSVDIDEFLEYFNSPNPNETLNLYCKSKVKFHFLTNYEDKCNYLRYLKINLSSDVKKIIFDFSSSGYELLFLSIYYWKEKYFPTSLLEFKPKLSPVIYKNLKDPDQEYLDSAIKESELIFEEIKNRLNWKNILSATIKYEIKDKLTQYNDITFRELATIIDIFKCDYLFTVFGKCTVDFLNSRLKKEPSEDE